MPGRHDGSASPITVVGISPIGLLSGETSTMPAEVSWYAMTVPSGDHAGCRRNAPCLLSVSTISREPVSVPSESITAICVVPLRQMP